MMMLVMMMLMFKNDMLVGGFNPSEKY